MKKSRIKQAVLETVKDLFVAGTLSLDDLNKFIAIFEGEDLADKVGQEYGGGFAAFTKVGYLYILAPQVSETFYNWDDAIKFAEKFTHEGHSDWFLPSLKQLNLLFKIRRTLPEEYAFGSRFIKPYWSRTEATKTQSWAEVMQNYTYPNIVKADKSELYKVRLLRKIKLKQKN